jgi:N-acetylmuramic acid 6-phosphate etherase
MAGGRKAVFRSQEGSEDNERKARSEARAKVRRGDIAVGIAASGVTPFVRGALAEARKAGAETILLTCNPGAARHIRADLVIAPAVGPEILSGSTRLKSGTVTKIALNMLTTLSMVRLGKVYGNRMVDLQPKSFKLRERGVRLVQELTGLSPAAARRVLGQARWSVKTAILMAKKT